MKNSVIVMGYHQTTVAEALAMSNTRNKQILGILNHKNFRAIEELMISRSEIRRFEQFKNLYRSSIDTRNCVSFSDSSCIEDLHYQTQNMRTAAESLRRVENLVCY